MNSSPPSDPPPQSRATMKMVPLGSGLRTWSWWSRRRLRLLLFFFISLLCSSCSSLTAHCVVLCRVSSTTTGIGAAWRLTLWPWCPSRSNWWRRSCSLRRRWSWWCPSVPHHSSYFALWVLVEVATRRRCSWLVCCVPADRLGEPVPQEVPGSGGGGVRAAGQEGGAGLVVQGDAANRLREKWSVSCCWPVGGTLRWCFVKLTSVAAVLLKIETWIETVWLLSSESAHWAKLKSEAANS